MRVRVHVIQGLHVFCGEFKVLDTNVVLNVLSFNGFWNDSCEKKQKAQVFIL